MTEEKTLDPNFEKVREALDKYYDFDETFNIMTKELENLHGADANEFAEEWFAEQHRLKIEVGKEFVKVTPNSIDKIPLVGIEFPEKISGYIRSERKKGT